MSTRSSGAFAPVGLSNPTVAFNVNGPTNYNPGQPFLDLMRTMRPWSGTKEGGGGLDRIETLIDDGVIGEDGYPRTVPGEYRAIMGLWDLSSAVAENPDLKEPYVVTWKGEGDIDVKGVEVLSREDGRITFLLDGTPRLEITRTDPKGTGDHIRDVHVVAESKLPLFEAGAVFDPDYLALIDDARQLRFMPWSDPNGEISSWGDLPDPDEPNLQAKAVHPEYMIQLANEVGADPWFVMPYQADDDFLRRFATLVRDELDPALTARIEYANEAWNFSYESTRYLQRSARDEWGVEGATQDYYVKEATEMAQIWREVFADEPERLKVVLGTQTTNVGVLNRMLSASAWKDAEPGAWVDPAETFDEIGVTHYFGRGTALAENARNDLLAILRDKSLSDPYKTASKWLVDRVLDPDRFDGIPRAMQAVQDNIDLAKGTGLEVVAYEGGSSVLQDIFKGPASDRDKAETRAFLQEFVRSDSMGVLYDALYDAWAETGQGPFMQFGVISGEGNSGFWAVHDTLDTITPQGEVLREKNATRDPWWDGAEGGVHYQQGVTRFGTDRDDVMQGTIQEDYLVGGAGDDTFRAGAGDDGINGGAGEDVLVLSGRLADYAVTPIEASVSGEARYRVAGPDGEDVIVGVEWLQFADGTRQAVGTKPGGGGSGGDGGGTGGGGTGGGGAASGAAMEVGTVRLDRGNDDGWIRISFTEEIEEPVVVVGPLTHNGRDPAVVQVRGVDESGFEARIQEMAYLRGVHLEEEFSWMAGTRGSHVTADGVAVTFGSATLSGGGDVDLDFGASAGGSDTMLLGTLRGDGEDAPYFRVESVGPNGARVHMELEEALAGDISGVERTLDWAAIDATGAAGGVRSGRLEVDHTTSAVPGTVAGAFFAGAQTARGNDPAQIRAVRDRDAVKVFVEEEQSRDGETRHLVEEVAWLSLGEGVYDLTAASAADEPVAMADDLSAPLSADVFDFV